MCYSRECLFSITNCSTSLSDYAAGWDMSSRTCVVRCSCWRGESTPAGTLGPTATGVTPCCRSGRSEWWVMIGLELLFLFFCCGNKCVFSLLLSASNHASYPVILSSVSYRLREKCFLYDCRCIFFRDCFYAKAFLGWYFQIHSRHYITATIFALTCVLLCLIRVTLWLLFISVMDTIKGRKWARSCTSIYSICRKTVTHWEAIYFSYRTPRITRFACMKMQTSRVVRWKCVTRTFQACGHMASRTVLPAFRSPVERKQFVVISIGLLFSCRQVIGP